MASTYTPLGIELQATGENAGTWGTKTNTNLQIIEQVSGGYTTQAVSDSGDTTLSVSDGSTGATLSHRVIEYATGTGTSAAVPNGKTVIAYAKADDGTNPNITMQEFGGDVVDDTSPQLGGNLDTNSFMIDFDDAHGVRDENANEQLIFETTSSAVNHIDITNAATGAGPQVGAVGDDSNVDLKLRPKGTGNIEIMGATNPGTVQLNCENNTHGIQLQSPPHSAAQSYTLKFPTGNVTADRFLKVDSITGSGTTAVGQLSFAEVSGVTTGKAIAMALIFG
jgi:hypothetical protein